MQIWYSHLARATSFSCHLLQFPKIFIFRSAVGIQAQSRFGALFRCDTRVYSQECTGIRIGYQYPTGVFPLGLTRIFLEVSFPKDETSRLQNVVFEVFLFWEHTVERLLWKDCSARAWLFLVHVIRPLQYWSLSPFISCRPKEAGPRCMGHPAIISKGGSLWLPKRVDLRFRRISSNAFGQRIWRVSTNFVNCILMTSLVLSSSPKD